MLYELRTYRLRPGAVPEFEKRFAEALPTREAYSKLGGFWRTEIGPLNQVVHVWPYEDLTARQQAREAAARDPSGRWPLKVDDLLLEMENEILQPAPFMDAIDGSPRELGNLYELRTYTYPSGSIPQVLEQFGKAIPGRTALYPLAACWYSDLGTLNRFFQLWPYKDWAHRDEVRREAQRTGVWPPRTDVRPLHQEVKHMTPAPFSPLR